MAKEVVKPIEQDVAIEQKQDVVQDNNAVQMAQLELLAKIAKQFDKQETFVVPDVPNDYLKRPEKPRRIVFQIAGMIHEDAMKDGAYHPGRTFGITKFKNSSELLNTNISVFDRNLDRWRTGFEVDEVDSLNIPDEQKQQRIKDIQIARAWLEYKIRTSLSDNNRSLWEGRRIVIEDLGKVYDTETSDDTLMLYYGILAGGYPEIAFSFEEAKKTGKRLYLSIYADEAKRKIAPQKLKFRASAKLDDIDSNWSIDDCLYLYYNLPQSEYGGYTRQTPKDTLLELFYNFINGEGESDKRLKPKEFLDSVEIYSSDPQYSKIKAVFNASLHHYGYIITDKTKTFVNKQTGFNYGSTKQMAMEKLLDPKNIEELAYLKSKIEEKWNK